MPFLTAFAITAHATPPCPHNTDCEVPIEVSMGIYAELAAIARLCAERDPVNASRYDAGFRKEIEPESQSERDRIDAVQRNPDLPRLIDAAYRATVAEQGSSWRHDCVAFLKKAGVADGVEIPDQ
ncbi:hypothetical protein ACVBGC_26290 [Burkholderia stagnalis]